MSPSTFGHRVQTTNKIVSYASSNTAYFLHVSCGCGSLEPFVRLCESSGRICRPILVVCGHNLSDHLPQTRLYSIQRSIYFQHTMYVQVARFPCRRLRPSRVSAGGSHLDFKCLLQARPVRNILYHRICKPDVSRLSAFHTGTYPPLLVLGACIHNHAIDHSA